MKTIEAINLLAATLQRKSASTDVKKKAYLQLRAIMLCIKRNVAISPRWIDCTLKNASALVYGRIN